MAQKKSEEKGEEKKSEKDKQKQSLSNESLSKGFWIRHPDKLSSNNKQGRKN